MMNAFLALAIIRRNEEIAQGERLRENEVQSNAASALTHVRTETRMTIQAHQEKVRDVLKQMSSLSKEGSTLLKSTQNDAIKAAVNALLAEVDKGTNLAGIINTSWTTFHD